MKFLFLFILVINIVQKAAGQNFPDSIDNRLIGNYYFFKNDYPAAVSYFSKAETRNSFDAALEIEAVIKLGDTDKAVNLLISYASNGLDTIEIFSNKTIKKFIYRNDLYKRLTGLFTNNSPDYLSSEIYHLLETDQLVRRGYVDDKTWVTIDTGYILPRILNYLSIIDTIKYLRKGQYQGLSTILLHQARYKSSYHRIIGYIEHLFHAKILSPYEYATIIDENLLYNTGVQKYGTVIVPQGNYAYLKVVDEKNIDYERAKIRLPPLLFDYNYLRMGLKLPKWYQEQILKEK